MGTDDISPPDTAAPVTAADRVGDVTPSREAASIEVRDLTKEFATDQGTELVFQDVSFEVEPGDFVSLIGKSGSGKSTMLNILSGILLPTDGEIRYVREDGSSDVSIGHVFQDPRLLPWDTLVQNIEYVHPNDPDYSRELAERYLDMVGLSDHYDKYPTQLSGGQRQRVGIARALSIDPEILLMDECFSNLDEITAARLREELTDLWSELNKTVFFVTHDITEAIELSNRILMIGDGRIYGDFDVDLDRPRSIDSEEFLRVRQRAIDLFHSIEDE